MRKLIVVFVMSFYCVGNILFPTVDMTRLQEMYKHCESEDPDINVPDFVFEHLLHIPGVFDEHGEENERPHQPKHLVNVCQNAFIPVAPIRFECREVFHFSDEGVFTVFHGQYAPTDYISKMLRPPIV